jgi:hypothetical protein
VKFLERADPSAASGAGRRLEPVTGSGRASRGVEWNPKVCMPAEVQIIGSLHDAPQACFHARAGPLRPTVRWDRTPPGSSFRDRSPLQSSFAPLSRPVPFDAGPAARVPGPPTTPPERVHSCEATQTPLRSVHGLSQPRDGLLRSPARGLVSSPSHVQGLACPGAPTSAQPPSLVGRSCPLAVAVRRTRRPQRSDGRAAGARLRGLAPCGDACCRNGDWPLRQSLPSSGFSLLQVLRSLAVNPGYPEPSTLGVDRRPPACAGVLRATLSVLSARDPTISREIADLPEISSLLLEIAWARRRFLSEFFGRPSLPRSARLSALLL